MRSYTRKILIWNKLHPKRMISPAALYFCSGLGLPQEDNAGTPQGRYQSAGNNSWSLTHVALISMPVDTFPAPSPPVSCSVPIAKITITITRWKYHQEKKAGLMLIIIHNHQKSSPGSLPWDFCTRICTSNFKFAIGTRGITHLATNWLSGRFPGRIIHPNGEVSFC